MKIVSLFSGAGGLDLGLIRAGNEVVWANDIDVDAVATYRRNISEAIVCADIKNIKMAVRGNRLHITIEATDSIALEKGMFEEKADFFESVFSIRPILRELRVFE